MNGVRALLSLLIFPTSLMISQPLSDEQTVLYPVATDPTVSFRVWFKVGSQDDPPGKEGLAALTASLLAEGSTKNNSYSQVLDKLFPLAAGYSASCSTEMTVIAGRTHRDNLGEFLPLFLDAILSPAFLQEDLDRLKKEALDELENTLRYASDEELGKAVLYNTVFGGTPYGHITTGLVSGVRAITLEDVRSFYREHYTRDNVVLGLGGGYDSGVLQRMREALGRLPAGMPAQVPPPVPVPLNGFHVTIVEKKGAATAISMGMPIDILRGSREWYALAVANSWFGEHRNSSSHLYQVIREARGLNYGDYSYIERFPSAGSRQLPPQNVCLRKQLFEIWIRPVPNEARLFALHAALREYRRLVTQGLTQQEFDLTRRFLSKYVLQYARSTMERLAYAMDDRFYGIQGSHLELFRKALKDMTLQEVNAAIRKYLRYGDMEIVFVTGDAAALRDALVAGSPASITYKTPKPASVLEEDKQIDAFPVPVGPEQIRIVQAGDLFER